MVWKKKCVRERVRMKSVCIGGANASGAESAGAERCQGHVGRREMYKQASGYS